ncbi:MAG TPA: D-Ala-D-Ala carboxypeptidase family metallohydrolase [archaeon]|jgi:zinc D-Ala-D-Ala carboxypeptidase|nr:D-Ala-D-Ala carboxypeptidase family metallohydrolase [archaeon]
MKLTENLSLAEVTKSATAIRMSIANTPSATHLIALKEVSKNIFQPCREHFGKPLAVTSGYRSEALNEAINGSKNSQHSKGEALDLDADVFGGFSNAELFNYIKDHLDFDQLIWEFGNNNNPAWVHCSYKTQGNRNEVLIAIKTNGKTTYRKI